MLAVDLRAPRGFRDGARFAQHARDILDLESAEHFGSHVAKASIVTAHVGRDSWAARSSFAVAGSLSNPGERIEHAELQRYGRARYAFSAGDGGA